MTDEKIAFIGTGIMGNRMAANLQNAGHTFTVHNRTKAKTDSLVEGGAVWADSPKDAVKNATIVITMLAHPDAVRETATGENGFLAAMDSGTLWIDCSTVKPVFSREMAAAADAHGVHFLDAPVAGSKPQAENAELVFIVGGAEADIDRARPLFDVMGRAVLHVGGHGMGTSLKVVVNMLLATSMASFAEGLLLGESLGVPQEMLLNVLIGGPVVAPFMAGKRDMLASGEYPAFFPLQWMQKDLQMATDAAYESGAVMPVANSAKELYRMAMRAGYSEADFAAVYDFLKQEA